ncbi:uncharacterized protein EV422DRAFT_524419 [Fimicolochytrium jonesii]|uniref:uncharacterized protein n=1 Tax=Fimicolochytrium jonesii TaxID=1396493 RepID=UPI0022FF0288|nr:uncharacterized protein EV422DRAFT_524419 [Fimicolochytrium jonesii]KAI8822544.1 hypothetical protein EV422DRAFT_524419 [Fimicolochytrium jonesii]
MPSPPPPPPESEADAEVSASVLEKLRVALDLVETLRSENEAFKENFDTLKLNHERLQERQADLTTEFDIIAKEKAVLETQTTDLATHFHTQLEQNRKELEAARAKIPNPKDLELVRLRTVREVEARRVKAWREIEKETEKYRSLYYALRRDHELAKADIDRERAQTSSKLKEMENLYQDELAALEARTLELRQTLDSAGDTRRMRELQRHNADLQLKVASLLPELEELRASKEKLQLTLDQTTRLHTRKLLDETSYGKALQSEKDALAARVTALSNELDQARRSLDAVTEGNNELRKEVERVKSLGEEGVHVYKVKVSDMNLAALKERNQYENAIADLKVKLTDFESQNKSAAESLQSFRHRLADAEKDALEKCRLAREEEWGKKAQVEAERDHLQSDLTTLKEHLAHLESQHTLSRRDLQNELSTLKSSNRALQSHNESLAKSAADAAAALEKANREVERVSRELKEAEGQAAEAGAVGERERREVERLRSDLQKAESALQSLQAELDQATALSAEEREAYVTRSERAKSTWTREKQTLSQKLELAVKEKQDWEDKTRELEDLLQRSQQLFKTKVQSIKGRAKEYKEEVGRLRKTVDIQARRADAITKEIHQRQNDFLGLLRNEGVVEASA